MISRPIFQCLRTSMTKPVKTDAKPMREASGVKIVV